MPSDPALNPAPPPSGFDAERERERAMNLENYRRAPDRSTKPRPQEAPVPMETTTAQPARGVAVVTVASSPRTARRASLPTTRHGISPGDLFIEQQAQISSTDRGKYVCSVLDLKNVLEDLDFD